MINNSLRWFNKPRISYFDISMFYVTYQLYEHFESSAIVIVIIGTFAWATIGYMLASKLGVQKIYVACTNDDLNQTFSSKSSADHYVKKLRRVDHRWKVQEGILRYD